MNKRISDITLNELKPYDHQQTVNSMTDFNNHYLTFNNIEDVYSTPKTRKKNSQNVTFASMIGKHLSPSQTPSRKTSESNSPNAIPDEVFNSINQFQTPQKKGTIDVWWLYDTGGISLLIAYILKNVNLWNGCNIRVFSVTSNDTEIETMKSK